MNELNINEMEQLVLLALVRLGEGAYGVPIREEIEERAGRSVSIAAVYAALDRLEGRGLIKSWLTAPTAERGGRAKKHFSISAEGAAALAAAREAMARMWEGVKLEPDLLDR